MITYILSRLLVQSRWHVQFKKVTVIILCTACLSCGSSGADSKNNSSSSTRATQQVSPEPYSDRNNFSPFLKDANGNCVEGQPNCSESSAFVPQFGHGRGFTGFVYGLGGRVFGDIDLDPLVSGESVSLYSGPVATYTAKHNPVAVESGKYIYFVYSGPAQFEGVNDIVSVDSSGRFTSLDRFKRKVDGRSNALGVYLARYDLIEKKASAPRLLHVKNTDDPHDNAVLNFDSDGDLYVLISGRSLQRGAFIYRIIQPNTFAHFADESIQISDVSPQNLDYASLAISAIDVPGRAPITYPNLLSIGDGFRLIYTVYCTRGVSSSCNGNTRQLWSAKLTYSSAQERMTMSEVRPLAAYFGHYAMAAASPTGLTIGVAFNVTVDGQSDERTNLYFLLSQDAGETWQYFDSRTGMLTDAESFLPIDNANELSRVRAVTYSELRTPVVNRLYLKDIVVNDDIVTSPPTILHLVSRGAESYRPTMRKIHAIRSTVFAGNWVTTTLSAQADHNYSTGFLRVENEKVDGVIFPLAEDQNRNAMAGGSLAVVDIDSNGIPSAERYVYKGLTTGVNNYLNEVCDMNYLRRVHRTSGDIIGIASAANPYQFIASTKNQKLPAAPLYLISKNGEILRLPSDLNEKRQVTLESIAPDTILHCDNED